MDLRPPPNLPSQDDGDGGLNRDFNDLRSSIQNCRVAANESAAESRLRPGSLGIGDGSIVLSRLDDGCEVHVEIQVSSPYRSPLAVRNRRDVGGGKTALVSSRLGKKKGRGLE